MKQFRSNYIVILYTLSLSKGFIVKLLFICICFLFFNHHSLVINPTFALESHTYFYHTDQVGSVLAVTDENGNLVEQSKYAPYGSLAMEQLNNRTIGVESESKITERGYTGQVKDNHTTLQYSNARYYDPTLSRFISADSVNDQLNRYNYVGGNPIMRNDPGGNMMISEDNDGHNDKNYLQLLMHNKIFSNKVLNHEWLSSTKIDKINTLIHIAGNIAPYSQKIQDTDNKERYAVWQLKKYQKSSLRNAPKIHDLLLEVKDKIRTVQQEREEINKQRANNTDLVNIITGYGTCENYPSVAINLINMYVPSATVYKTIARYKDENMAHAFLLYTDFSKSEFNSRTREIYNAKIARADATPDMFGKTVPLTFLGHDEFLSYYDLLSLDYDQQFISGNANAIDFSIARYLILSKNLSILPKSYLPEYMDPFVVYPEYFK